MISNGLQEVAISAGLWTLSLLDFAGSSSSSLPPDPWTSTGLQSHGLISNLGNTPRI